MAPPSIQQLLHSACQQANDNFGNEGGPFDAHFRISNFLRNLENRRSPSSEKQQGFLLRFPFPFSGLSFGRERYFNNKQTHISDLKALAHHPLVDSNKGSLDNMNERPNRLHAVDMGEDVGAHSGDNIFSNGKGLQGFHPSVRMDREDGMNDGDHGDHLVGKYGREGHIYSSMELQILQRQFDNNMDFASAPPSREILGRATWTFLHTLAAQFPEKPTRQQQRDAKELMAILSRLYPCKECADHFKEVLTENPVQAGSGIELAQWMCRVHNVVNRSLGRASFPCQRVDARWGALHCAEAACDLQGRMN